MLKAINTKFLLAILAALLTIVGALAYRRCEIGKAAMVLQRQKQYDAFRQQVKKDKKKHTSTAGNEGKTWQKYLP